MPISAAAASLLHLGGVLRRLDHAGDGEGVALSAQYYRGQSCDEQPSQDPAKMEKALAAAAEIGIPIVNCGPGGKSDDESTFQTVVDSLGKLADRAKHYGVTLCFKAHVGQYVYNTPSTLKVLAHSIIHRSAWIWIEPHLACG